LANSLKDLPVDEALLSVSFLFVQRIFNFSRLAFCMIIGFIL
jgi:hypothetical protein